MVVRRNLGAPPTFLDKTQFSKTSAIFESVDASILAFGNGNGYFKAHQSNLGAVLAAAYDFYLLIKGNSAAIERAMSRHVWVNRKRKPRLGNPALCAVMLALNPVEPRDRSTCSDYACILITAAAQSIAPGNFCSFVSGTTVADCKKIARAQRAGGRSARIEISFSVSMSDDDIEGVGKGFVRIRDVDERGGVNKGSAVLDPETTVEVIHLLLNDDVRLALGSVLELAAGRIKGLGG